MQTESGAEKYSSRGRVWQAWQVHLTMLDGREALAPVAGG